MPITKKMSQATLGIGDNLNPTTPAGETYTVLGEVVTIVGPNTSKTMVEVADMSSPALTFLSDVPDIGQIVITGQLDETDTGIARLRSDAQTDAARRFFQITKRDRADDTVDETATILGEVQEFSEDNSRGAVKTFSCTIKISGKPIYA